MKKKSLQLSKADPNSRCANLRCVKRDKTKSDNECTSHVIDKNDDTMKEQELEDPATTQDQRQHKSVKQRLHSILICSLDTLFSMTIVAPCVVVYWRGTWELSAHVLDPFGMLYSSIISLAVGLSGYFMLAIVQRPLARFLNPSVHRLSYFVVSRIYTFLFAFVSVNMWRGIWSMCDYFTGTDSLIITSSLTSFTFVCLLGTRTLRNLLASPFALAGDHYNGYFVVDTLFKIQVGLKHSIL